MPHPTFDLLYKQDDHDEIMEIQNQINFLKIIHKEHLFDSENQISRNSCESIKILLKTRNEKIKEWERNYNEPFQPK